MIDDMYKQRQGFIERDERCTLAEGHEIENGDILIVKRSTAQQASHQSWTSCTSNTRSCLEICIRETSRRKSEYSGDESEND